MRMPTLGKRAHLIDCVVLVALVAAVYGRLVVYGFLSNWDDNWFVLYNESIRGFSWDHVRAAFSSYIVGAYVPLQTVSFMLDHAIWGINAGGFHLTNIILHAVNGLLVYRLFIRWYEDRFFALVASALFLLHPVQVESVAWISNRKTLLSMFFFLLAWEWYCRYRNAAADERGGAYAASIAAFSLALLSKSIAVIFPVVLVLYDLCFPEGNRRPRLKDKLPFIIAAAVITSVTLVSQNEPGGARVQYHGGTPLATLYTMVPVFGRYMGMLVWPAGLSAYYAPVIHHSLDAAVGLAAILIGMVFLIGWRLYKVDRRLGFWVMFFFVGFLPVSQIVPMLSIMNDRYLYFPMVGVAALAGSGAVWFRERLGFQRRLMLHILIWLPLTALSVVSFQRTAFWRDSLTLWSDAVTKAPASDKAWEILGEAYKDSGKTDAARRAYERGLKLNPSNTEILQGLGDLYTEQGELDKGYDLLKKLLEMRPAYVTGWASLGNNYLTRGDYVEAEKSYMRARDLQPEAMQVVAMLGNLYLVQGRIDLARDYYGQIETKGEGNPESAYNMACVESIAGRKDEALAWLEKAVHRGFNDYGRIHDDKQLSALRNDPRFIYLFNQYIQK